MKSTNDIQRTRDIIAAARADAAAMLEEHKARLEEERHRTINDARIEGEKQAALIIMKAQQQRLQLITTWHAKLTRISIEVAKEVVGSELRTQPESVEARIRRALTLVSQCTNVRIQVNPQDRETVSTNLMNFTNRDNTELQFEIISCDAIVAGDAVLQTEAGFIEIGTGAFMKAIEKHFAQLDPTYKSSINNNLISNHNVSK